jgi:hypothetical protein
VFECFDKSVCHISNNVFKQCVQTQRLKPKLKNAAASM